MPKRVFSDEGGLPSLESRDPGGLLEMWPNVCEWLCDANYEDGSPVGAVLLQIRPEGSVFKATLKIADGGGRKVETVADTLSDALCCLDVLLKSPKCPWQVDPFPLGGKPKKK